MPGEDYLGAYYNSAYRVPPERYFAAARREVPLVRRMLARRHSSRGCLLEVGASYGAMLAALRDDGWDVIGTELDRRAAEQAHARYGIDVRFEALAVVPDKGPLDAVVLFHVIEHLPEPEAFLVAVRAQLKRGGTLLLKTPNGGSWLAEHVQGWWEWFAPPEHVHVFSPVSLDLVLKRAGFVPDYTTTRLGDAHPVTFELLAPNGHPVQTTSDLRSFWENTYPLVRKELRGRYPKHPWPEDPWNAKPTHRTKR